MVPENECKRQTPRRSIALFLHPDKDAEIVPLDGSNKYPPVKAGDFAKNIYQKVYK